MNKIKEYLYELSLLGVIGRSFVVGPTFSDALIIVALVSAVVYQKDFLFKRKIDDKEDLIAQAKADANAILLKIAEEKQLLRADIDILKNEIVALKIDRGFKNNNILKSPVGVPPNEQIRRF